MGMSDDDEWANAATVRLEGLRICKSDGVESAQGSNTVAQLPRIAKISDAPPDIASQPPPDSETEIIDPVLLSALDQQRERLNILKFEDKIVRFMKQAMEKRLEFPSLSSYHRLIVHRIAERFCVLHQSQPSSQQDTGDLSPTVGGGETGSLVLLKTPDSRLPRTFLIDIVNPATPSSMGGMDPKPVTRVSPLSTPSSTSGSKKVLLMRRDPKGSRTSPDAGLFQRKSTQVSVAEKEKAYAEARARIFGNLDVTCMSSEGVGDSGESESCSSRIGSNNNKSLGLERGETAMTGRKDMVKGKNLGGGNYCQIKGPDGTNGFGLGRGRLEMPIQGGVVAEGPAIEKFIKPAKETVDRSSPPPVQSSGPNDELERRKSPSNTALSSAPKAVDAGEWLRDGKVRARRRDDGMELDPDFRRGYDVYRPCYAPYRDVKEPRGGMSGAGNSLLLQHPAQSPELYEQPSYVESVSRLGRGVVDFGLPQQRASGYHPPYPSPPMGQYGLDREYSGGGYDSDMGLRMIQTVEHQGQYGNATEESYRVQSQQTVNEVSYHQQIHYQQAVMQQSQQPRHASLPLTSPPPVPFGHAHYPQPYGQYEPYPRDFRLPLPVQQQVQGTGRRMENSAYNEDFPALGGKNGERYDP